jgi:hypothetical protein
MGSDDAIPACLPAGSDEAMMRKAEGMRDESLGFSLNILDIGNWNLRFIWNLEFEHWNLEKRVGLMGLLRRSRSSQSPANSKLETRNSLTTNHELRTMNYELNLSIY